MSGLRTIVSLMPAQLVSARGAEVALVALVNGGIGRNDVAHGFSASAV